MLSELTENTVKTSALALAGSLDTIKGLINFSTDTLWKYGTTFLGNIWDQASIYTLCPRRFNDWIKDSSDSALAAIRHARTV